MKVTYYTDPGHGWLRVPYSKLEAVGVQDRISIYSYRRGDYVYLEEDLDAGNFLEAWKNNGGQGEVVTSHTDRSSRIRTYQAYYCD